MISEVFRLLAIDWKVGPQFDECPLCPILHCTTILFEPPQCEVFGSIFPFEKLQAFANAERKELALLAFNVLEVITRNCIGLLQILARNGLG
jgi:hypothetical protein